jgi:KaiC/GvpD/RAD55 family RecA-like ATPase
MPNPDPQRLPEWTAGTVAILSTFGEWPHSIPISTGLRAGDRLVMVALAARRVSLANLRANPKVSLSLMSEGDVAVTALANASVVADPMELSDRVCAVALEVVRIQDHGQPRFVIESGVSWRWTDPEAEARDALVRAELSEIAERLTSGETG